MKVKFVLSLSLLAALTTNAAIQMSLVQEGNNLILSVSGTANTEWFNHNGEFSTADSIIDNGHANLITAPEGVEYRAYWNLYDGPVYIAHPGATPITGHGSGDIVGINGHTGRVFLPIDYVSGAELSGYTIFENVSLADLGFSDGQTYTWSWGAVAGHHDTLTLTASISPVPEPAHYTMLAGLVAVVSCVLLRRKKSKAA